VRLAAARLAVCEDRRVVAAQHVVDEGPADGVEEVGVGRRWWEHGGEVVERVAVLVLAPRRVAARGAEASDC
jgi:hypothetical protein